MRAVKGCWYAGTADTELMFEHFLTARRHVVAELSWVAGDINDSWAGNAYMAAAATLNNDVAEASDNGVKRPWSWTSPEGFRYFIEWEPYPMSVTESKLA